LNYWNRYIVYTSIGNGKELEKERSENAKLEGLKASYQEKVSHPKDEYLPMRLSLEFNY